MKPICSEPIRYREQAGQTSDLFWPPLSLGSSLPADAFAQTWLECSDMELLAFLKALWTGLCASQRYDVVYGATEDAREEFDKTCPEELAEKIKLPWKKHGADGNQHQHRDFYAQEDRHAADDVHDHRTWYAPYEDALNNQNGHCAHSQHLMRKNSFAANHNDRVAEKLQITFVERDQQTYGPPSETAMPVVQFEAPQMFAFETDGIVRVGVMRIGNVDRESSVHYETGDVTATAGKKYVATKGTIFFEPGERKQYIQICIMNDEQWDSTLEFCVDMHRDTCINCVPGRFLWTTRIKIIDDDTFPSCRMKESLQAGELDFFQTTILFYDYLLHAMANETVRRGVIKSLICDQVDMLYFLIGLFLNMYLVDFVLCSDCDKDRAPMLLGLVVLLRFAPFPLIHYLDFRQCHWKIGGASRKHLQTNLLRKYLNYNESSRQQVDESVVVLSILTDSKELSSKGVCKIVELVSSIFRLFIIVSYQALAPRILDTADNNMATTGLWKFGVGLTFPLTILCFLFCRNKRMMGLLNAESRHCQHLLRRLQRILSNYPLLRDYAKRGAAIDSFTHEIDNFNEAHTALNAAALNSRMITSWVTVLVICILTYIMGMLVVEEQLTLGEFLNTLSAYNAIGATWGKIYGIVLDMQFTFDSLGRVVGLMNLPTDVDVRANLQKRRARVCEDDMRTHKESELTLDYKVDPADQLCIRIKELRLFYDNLHTDKDAPPDAPAFAVLPQGGFYTLIGPPSSGKGTILKLMGSVNLPHPDDMERPADAFYVQGDVMIPAHLRVLHVVGTPEFVEGSLYKNLTYGCSRHTDKDTDDTELTHVLNICKEVMISDATLKLIENTNLVMNWASCLSSSDSMLVSIARALVMNPDVLIMHKPALFLDQAKGDNIYDVLKKHVRERGLDQDKAKFHFRRPRTCIVSARRLMGTAAPDMVYHVGRQPGRPVMSLLDVPQWDPITGACKPYGST